MLSTALLAACAQAGPGSGSSGDQSGVDGGGGGGDDDGTGSGLGSGLGGTDAGVDSMPVMIDAAPAQVLTKTFTVKLVGTNYWRGWIQKNVGAGTASHDPALDNTFTGEISPGVDLDSYMVFPLTGITASNVIDATLRLEVQGFEMGNATTETLSVWDVTTPADQVENTTNSVAIHDDLETGTKYGMFTAKATDVGTILTIPLNAAAATDIKAKIGQDFTIGMSMDTVPGYVLFSSNNETRTHELVIHYNP